ncbi:tumor necrosis factor receptor superfamily member 1A-like isoform X1 [Seriola lalandi dorsalis]|uniref:Tumor necrosis factor receptor superfamily, member 1a n=1 Tax=Seriola lalandi dorsalis TaxID=1841481 RepID=A0A3B4YQS9_SERLL|nr:tumor necrosis factor receptor superfamily member 1A-like isoform X1 [Seriola lalandi dorsalis]XP_056236286.1 tumor necrosis factor receptor superfamily member 1A isoform X1 [Seriola aureovittata]
MTMEGAGHRGRWIKKAHYGTTLLLMCTLTLASLEPSEKKKCETGEYESENGICCNKCHRGSKLIEECHAPGQRSNCTPCPDNQYMDNMNSATNCKSCRSCTKRNEFQFSPCKKYENTICRCISGYYKYDIDGDTSECRKCKQCGPHEKEKQKCTLEENTVCECKEKYYKVKGKCEPCENCTNECSHLCQNLHTKAPDKGNEFLINIIVGVVSVGFLLLVLVVLITYIVTKRCTQRNLQKPPSQPSDVSPDSCEQVLICREEPLDNSSVKAISQSPVSEQQPSNLPDCVPLEIKITDLIYTVLDLVPVLQVKQLVRTLGVMDTEIEQAEMDHRSCREAHYQMLRVWAERGSRAGGGGRGGMLHWSLMQELSDILRKMHLGRAAEELETKYGIQ